MLGLKAYTTLHSYQWKFFQQKIGGMINSLVSGKDVLVFQAQSVGLDQLDLVGQGIKSKS